MWCAACLCVRDKVLRRLAGVLRAEIGRVLPPAGKALFRPPKEAVRHILVLGREGMPWGKGE